jgi:hypothetical protein
MGDSNPTRRSIAAPIGVALMLAMSTVVACTGPAGDRRAVCDGISAELGGCAPDRAAFSATDCDGIAREFASQLEARILAIIDGPESSEESKATRVGNVVVVTSQLANLHVRRSGLIKECTAAAFIDAADSRFTPKFRKIVGQYLYDGPAVDYATWRANLSRELSILDRDEDVPAPSAASETIEQQGSQG